MLFLLYAKAVRSIKVSVENDMACTEMGGKVIASSTDTDRREGESSTGTDKCATLCDTGANATTCVKSYYTNSNTAFRYYIRHC